MGEAAHLVIECATRHTSDMREVDAPSFTGVVQNVGEFLFEAGRRLLVHPYPDVDPLRLRTVILGPGIAVMLRQRGLAVLHGASVATSDGFVAFLGDCGAGKSTTASLFYAAGYGVGGDDVCAIDVSNHPVVFPSYPQIKLRKDAARALHGTVDHLQPLYRRDIRRLEEVWERFPTTPLPLKKVYILRFAEEYSIVPLDKRTALAHIIEHSRAIPPLSEPVYLQERMQQAASIVESVPVALLNRPKSVDQAGGVVETVLADIDG